VHGYDREGKEPAAVAKRIKKTTRRVRKTAIFFLGALVAGTSATSARASRTSDQQQTSEQPATRQSSEQQVTPTQGSEQPTTTQSAGQQTTPQTSGQQGTTQAAGKTATGQPPASKPAQQDTSHSQLSAKEQARLQHQTEKGTSKDRILWTLPNFLTVENADNIPPLTAGQKFKVVGRSLIDPSEFVLVDLWLGSGKRATAIRRMDKARTVTRKGMELRTQIMRLRILWRARCCLSCCIRIRAVTNWAAVDFGGERCTR
jgi:hypothetical protein